MGYSINQYGEVFNSEDTFDATANDLALYGSVCLNWIDQAGTRLDVLFTTPHYVGTESSAQTSRMFVAVWNFGAYSFMGGVDPSYVSEKLGVRGTPTTQPLSELINSVLVRM